MKHAQTQDLTVGSPVKVLSIYALPMLISMFFQQAYNLVDSWIAGNYIGDVALGAVGTCYPITVFLIAISSGLSLGTSIFCSQAFGAKRYEQVKTAIHSSIYVYIPLAVVVSITGLILSPNIVNLLSVPAEAHDATVVYLRIYMIGFSFQFLYNIANGVLTGLGNSRTPLIYLIISSICNIALDWFFVAVLNTGIAGLALATILSQLLSAILTLWTVHGVCKKNALLRSNILLECCESSDQTGYPQHDSAHVDVYGANFPPRCYKWLRTGRHGRIFCRFPHQWFGHQLTYGFE